MKKFHVEKPECRSCRPCNSNDLILIKEGLQCGNCLAVSVDNGKTWVNPKEVNRKKTTLWDELEKFAKMDRLEIVKVNAETVKQLQEEQKAIREGKK